MLQNMLFKMDIIANVQIQDVGQRYNVETQTWTKA